MANKKVLPGEFISTEEEFEPGKNAFEENGSIFSEGIGVVHEDHAKKTVLVEKVKNVVPIRVHDMVFGRVMLVKDNAVVLSICAENKAPDRNVLQHTLVSLPVRLVSRDFVKNLRELFKVGDVVKAKIASVLPYETDVRTNEPELGVVRAFCSECRQPLHLFDSQLKCLRCGSAEKRKISEDYALK